MPIMSMLTIPCGQFAASGSATDAMEFRCRLASPNGEIIEASTSPTTRPACATSSRTRACTSSSLQPAGRDRRPLRSTLPQRKGVPTREFLVFNQELATLLKAGMPLVQSLDLLKRRVDVAGLPGGARRCPREGAVGDGAVGRVRRAHGDVSARLHGLAAGGRAQRQPRRGAAPLRRVHEDRRDRASARRSRRWSTRRF